MSGVDIGKQMGPDYLIELDNRDITSNFRPRLLSLTVTDNRGMELDTFSLTLDDSDGKIIMPQRGNILRVYIGWQGSVLFHKGEFTITGIRHEGATDKLTLSGFSADLGGSLKENRTDSYDQTTVGEIVQRIAGRNGLEAALLEDIAAIAIDHIDQTNESDLQFFSRLAERTGQVAQVKFGKLMLIKPGNNTTASGEPLPELVIQRQEGDSHAFDYKRDSIYSGTRARWLRLDKASSGWVTCKAGGGGHGEMFETAETRYLVLPTLYASQEEAMQAVQAEWQKNIRVGVTLDFLLAMGRPDLLPDMKVSVSGFKQLIDRQIWVVTSVAHTIDAAGGFRSKVAFEMAGNDGQVVIEPD